VPAEDAPLLSAVLIVRDEGALLADCLGPVRAVADEVVVVDTGSVDDSVAIARSFGALVIDHPWRDDFSEARNAGLDHATGRWVLYVDADERLESWDPGELRALLAGSEAAALRLVFYPQLDASAYLEYRIWRNDPSVRFEGIIHETIVPAVLRLAARERRAIETADLVIRHLGYEGDQRRKHLRNLPLLRREVVRTPDNLFVRHHLFRVLSGLGHHEEATAVLAAAVERFDQLEAAGRTDHLGALILYEALARQEPGDERRALLARALAVYPENIGLLLMEGEQLAEDGRYEDAIALADRVLVLAGNAPGEVAYRTRLLGESPHALKALCLLRLGRDAEAAAAYARAAELAPDDPSYPVKRDLAAARARAETTPLPGDQPG